jgi:hypothetical protein
MVKYFIYGFFGLALIFCCAAAYLFYFADTGADRRGYGVDSSLPDSLGGSESRTRPISGKGGNLLIVYTGDIKGSLLPCG